MSERRNRQRTDACLNAVWEGASGRYDTRVTDVSEEGCYIDSISEVHLGEQVTVRVQLPDGGELTLDGLVAHYSPRVGFGVRFSELTPLQIETLRSLISRLSSSPSET
jgi:hypothetical protein